MISKIAAPSDRDLTIRLFEQIVSETAQVNPAFMSWSESSIREAWDHYEFYLLVSEEGFPMALICFQRNADWIEIFALGILRIYQGKRLMKSFLSDFVAKCGATSKTLCLEVHVQNQPAIDLYTQFGFKTVRIRKNYYSDTQDALVMDLILEGS